MKTKKHTVFLLISLAVFIASVIVVVVDYLEAKANIYNTPYVASDTQLRVGLELSLFWCTFFISAVLGAELSFIRSVYKMLKFKPNKWVRLCYIISASLALLSITFYCLFAFKVLDFLRPDGNYYTGSIFFIYTLWPSFFLSFILGSMPTGYWSNKLI